MKSGWICREPRSEIVKRYSRGKKGRGGEGLDWIGLDWIGALLGKRSGSFAFEFGVKN